MHRPTLSLILLGTLGIASHSLAADKVVKLDTKTANSIGRLCDDLENSNISSFEHGKISNKRLIAFGCTCPGVYHSRIAPPIDSQDPNKPSTKRVSAKSVEDMVYYYFGKHITNQTSGIFHYRNGFYIWEEGDGGITNHHRITRFVDHGNSTYTVRVEGIDAEDPKQVLYETLTLEIKQVEKGTQRHFILLGIKEL